MNNNKQHKTGRVVSHQMAQTVVVSVDAFVSHPLYGKKIRRTRRFLADNPGDKARLGDWVTIVETRPLSKLKRWRVQDIKTGTDQKTVAEDIQEVDAALNQN